MSDREVIYEIIVCAWAESGNQPVVVETAERIAKEIIEAGFISLKEWIWHGRRVTFFEESRTKRYTASPKRGKTSHIASKLPTSR